MLMGTTVIRYFLVSIANLSTRKPLSFTKQNPSPPPQVVPLSTLRLAQSIVRFLLDNDYSFKGISRMESYNGYKRHLNTAVRMPASCHSGPSNSPLTHRKPLFVIHQCCRTSFGCISRLLPSLRRVPPTRSSFILILSSGKTQLHLSSPRSREKGWGGHYRTLVEMSVAALQN